MPQTTGSPRTGRILGSTVSSVDGGAGRGRVHVGRPDGKPWRDKPSQVDETEERTGEEQVITEAQAQTHVAFGIKEDLRLGPPLGHFPTDAALCLTAGGRSFPSKSEARLSRLL